MSVFLYPTTKIEGFTKLLIKNYKTDLTIITYNIIIFKERTEKYD